MLRQPLTPSQTEDRNAIIATVLPDYHRWLHRLAYDLLPAGSADHDDLVSEGYVAMWRAFETYDSTRGALPTWLTGAARLRMRDLAFGSAQWFGHEPVRGHRDVETDSLDAWLDSYGESHDAFGVDVLDGVEQAYHDGEIAEAMAGLSPSQREYVYVRFWLGIDPGSRTPVMQALREQFPVVKKRYLWSGSSKMVGARERLAESLGHLAPA